MTYYEGDYQRGEERPYFTPVEYYLSPDRKWRWRVTARNGQVVSASHQGFWSKWNAKRNYRRSLRG